MPVDLAYRPAQLGLEDLEGEILRLAAFLGMARPSKPKLRAVMERVSFDAMRDRKVVTIRKGVVGDHLQHLTPRHWAKMDQLFRERLGDVDALRPLYRYMGIGTTGMMGRMDEEEHGDSSSLSSRGVAAKL